jgi:hypothetical protein
MDYATAGILTGMACAALGYSVLLESLHDRYTPDHIWVTVAGGFVIVGAGLWLWLWFDPLDPLDQFGAFWRFTFLTITAGCPTISWQIGQNRARRNMRQRDEVSTAAEKRNGSEFGSEGGGFYDEDTRRA